MDRSEEERSRALIGQILQGKRRLFHELVGPYEQNLYLIANAILRNEADAEDAVQEANLKAFLHLRQLIAPEKFKSWIFRIVVNESRMKIRNSRRHLFQSLERENQQDAECISSNLADCRKNPFETMERAEVRAAVNQALQRLPKIYREIFIFRDVQELNVAECAEILGITPESVKVRLHRARLMMREELAPRFKPRSCGRIVRGIRRNKWRPVTRV